MYVFEDIYDSLYSKNNSKHVKKKKSKRKKPRGHSVCLLDYYLAELTLNFHDISIRSVKPLLHCIKCFLHDKKNWSAFLALGRPVFNERNSKFKQFKIYLLKTTEE